jgi:hypothetical protein
MKAARIRRVRVAVLAFPIVASLGGCIYTGATPPAPPAPPRVP